MINNNNRQSGRRRGRGSGPRTPGQSPNPGNNRQDNRSRGNASQLLEKYKSLARDAQMQGDRVQAEYYLQFAEHYFRVLGESRARFEEQRRQRGDYSQDEDEDQDEIGASDGDEQGDDRSEREYRDERGDRNERSDRGDRGDRNERSDRSDRDRPRRDYRDERNGDQRPQPQQAARRPRSEEAGEEDRGEERISLEVLPPAIAADNDAPAKAPRRRLRRPREDDSDIAPAA